MIPPTVRTDASQYGYGAYLFQEKEGEEWPILFLSRSFHKAELMWHICVPGPMESLQIDYCGPFPADEECGTQVLNVKDTFTRAVGLYTVKDLEAKQQPGA